MDTSFYTYEGIFLDTRRAGVKIYERLHNGRRQYLYTLRTASDRLNDMDALEDARELVRNLKAINGIKL